MIPKTPKVEKSEGKSQMLDGLKSSQRFWQPHNIYIHIYIHIHTVDGRNPAPVEVGSLSHYLIPLFTKGVLYTIQTGGCGGLGISINHQQYPALPNTRQRCPESQKTPGPN